MSFNWNHVLAIVGTSLTGVGTVLPGIPGVIMTIIGSAILMQVNPSQFSKPTAAIARKLTPAKGLDTLETPP